MQPTPDLRWLLSGDSAHQLSAWLLDWDLKDKLVRPNLREVRTCLEGWMRTKVPYEASLPGDREPNNEEVRLALWRHGAAMWTEEDIPQARANLVAFGLGHVDAAAIADQASTIQL